MIYDISILAANTANNITIKNVLEQVVKIPEKYLPNTYFINLTVEQRESLNEGNTIYVDVDYDIYNCVEVVFFDQQPVYLKRYKTLQYFYGFGINSRTNPGPYYYYYLAPASSNSQFKLQRSTINIPTATSELTNDAGFITSIPDEYITETELTEKAYITKEVANLTNYYTKTETDGQFAKLSKYGDEGIHMGRAADSTDGQYSSAIGRNNEATNQVSMALGYQCKSYGIAALAEGFETTAYSAGDHAEGYGTKAGDTTVTDAGYVRAAHAEGYMTTAVGAGSHAEGQWTVANSGSSHAEGYGTIASSGTQHVQGTCNIEDPDDVYAHIVGNGEDTDTRSNAHTLTWTGEAWYQGDVYVGSTSGINKDEGSKKLATEEYVNNNLAIKTISENIAFVNGTKPSYTNGWYNFTGTITINGTNVSSNGYWDETSLIQIKDDGDRIYFYFIDPDDIEHKDYLSAYVYYDVETGIWKPEENDTVYTKKVLTKENTNEYTPTGDYNPSTKKYVDDAIAELKAYIDNAIANAVFAADATDHEPTTTIE